MSRWAHLEIEGHFWESEGSLSIRINSKCAFTFPLRGFVPSLYLKVNISPFPLDIDQARFAKMAGLKFRFGIKDKIPKDYMIPRFWITSPTLPARSVLPNCWTCQWGATSPVNIRDSLTLQFHHRPLCCGSVVKTLKYICHDNFLKL